MEDEWDYKFTLKQIKCPVDYGPREILQEISVDETIPVDDWNLMVLQCSWCTRMGKRQDPTVKRVVHCYTFVGEYVRSKIDRI